MKKLQVFIFMLFAVHTFAQVGIGTNSPDAQLDVVSADAGVLIPRITDTALVTAPVNGMLIFETTRNQFAYYDVNHWRFLYSRDKVTTVVDGNLTTVNVSGNNDGAVKIRYNHSGFMRVNTTTAGVSSIDLSDLLTNTSTTLAPTYVTGEYPIGNSEPTDVTTNQGVLMEGPEKNQANFWRINFTLQYDNNPANLTTLANNNQVLLVRVNSIGSGTLVNARAFIIPRANGQGALNLGIDYPLQLFFPTISDDASIGVGYRISFLPLGDLDDHIKIKMEDVTRVNTLRTSVD